MIDRQDARVAGLDAHPAGSHRMKQWLAIILGAFVLMSTACAEPTPPDAVARVSVLASGEIQLDGHGTDLARLERRLRQLEADGGTVWYYRDHPAQEPPPNALAVLDLIVRSGLPVRMSSRPDFSDHVDDSGRAAKRTP